MDRDNVAVKQLRAEICAAEGRHEEAATLLRDVGYALGEPYCLRKSAYHSAKMGDKATAIRCLDDALALNPRDGSAREQVAILRASICDYVAAAEHFGELGVEQPEEPTFVLNQARCHFLSGDPDRALQALSRLFNVDPVPLEAVYAKSQILKDIGRPSDALSLLREHKKQGWSDARFVASYISVAYAGNCDREADEALQRLDALRGVSVEARTLLRPHSISEPEEWLGDRARVLQQTAEQLVAGQMPWLFAERLNNQPLMWAWFVRTQPLDWLSEDIAAVAAHTTYASNGYSVLFDEDGERRLLPIQAAASGEAIVLDLTAAFTLERLGLLERVLAFYASTTISSSFLETVVLDSAQLRPQQPSRLEEQHSILDAIRQGKLKVHQGDVTGLQVVDDFAPSEMSCFSTSQLLAAIGVGPEMAASESTESALTLDRPVAIQLETCQLLARQGHLEAVVSFVDSHISKEDAKTLTIAREVEQARAMIRTQHESLWARLRAHPKVKFRPLPASTDNSTEVEETPHTRSLAFDSGLVAEELKLPCLVDDRFVQAMILNRQPGCSHAAFGTSQLLAHLHATHNLTDHEFADSVLTLIRWRYRFVVLSNKALRVLFDCLGLPALREVASYVHASTRDPGLFGGAERASPPIPLAFRFYLDWERSVAGFASSIWLDTTITRTTAEQITDWALTELLPSIPRSLVELEPRIASLVASSVLTQLIFELFTTRDRGRGNIALTTAAKQLGVTKNEYLKITGKVISGTNG